ncbi:MAG: PEP-utilizing enzyme [Candidatus Woesearchaeota archaeon]
MNFQKTNNKWQLIVARRNCMLRINLILNGASQTLKNEIDFDDNQVLALSYADERGLYNNEESLGKMGMAIVKAIKEKTHFIENNVKKCIEVSENLVKTAEKSSQQQNLLSAFEDYVKKHFEFSTFMFFPIWIEKIITNQVIEGIKNLVPEERVQETIEKLTSPSKILESTQEQIDLMKIASGETKDTLEEHQQKYEFLSVYNQDENPESIDSFKVRFEALQKTNLKQRLQNFHEDYHQREENFNDTIRELKISGHLLDIIKMLREYVYLRSYRLEMLNKSNLLIQPLLKKISRQFDLGLKEVCALTAEEIICGLKIGNLPTTEEINSRIEGYIYFQEGKNYKIFVKDLKEIKKIEFGEEKNYQNIKTFKGTPACHGKVQGVVRVIRSKNEISLLKSGEVLVTSMTTPDYIQAMEKSVAIITDEGGLLCHAAIVARELNKPCIIGTEIATKVLQTGDLVEIDTEKSIVKKI